ncbi:hypothetical protein CANARDRAFT_174521 [[Candida] arabinofermentans NRRL YB-2248]|uniref:Kinase n=1 Tax=[Candida] arabinofermentans NRRL YB-2248 TaxID=983967 RepID=A0A1E4T6V7_9ASCO|nr:hypothetical protein CANARDRAFT_174521 [[Candida] arabinofermentans NRRL YB-2248]
MNLVPLEHRAAGHDGPMQSNDGAIFAKPAVQAELDFYNNILSQYHGSGAEIDEFEEPGSRLIHWMPRFFGKLASNDPGAGDDNVYIVLDNALHGFKKPSILDIKLGSILYDETASPEKVERMKKVSNETTSGSLGFRICGMKIIKQGDFELGIDGLNEDEVLDKDQDGFITFNKFFGRKLTDSTVSKGLELFFKKNDLPSKIQDQLIETFLIRLKLLYNCMLSEEVRIISGSLFFVFENDIDRWEELQYNDHIIDIFEYLSNDGDESGDEDEDEPSKKNLSTLKFIDFAHAKMTPGESYDENLVKGIDNLINIVEKF